MKPLLTTTIAAVLLGGCGEPPKPPDISIHEAAMKGNIEAVKQHLAAGADVNAKDQNGKTPLHYAAWKGHKEIAELLIANEADVNAKNHLGFTPLDKARGLFLERIFRPEKETVDLLRNHGGKTGGD